jgi:hypothetical protein
MMGEIGDFSSTDLYKMENTLEQEDGVGEEEMMMVTTTCCERHCLIAHKSVF